MSIPVDGRGGNELAGDFELIRDVSGFPNLALGIVAEEITPDLQALKQRGSVVWVDGDPLVSLSRLVHAPNLVPGRSAFSYLAALLNENTVFYRDFWWPPMPGWIALSSLKAQRKSI
jgi:hypothetical protein